MRSLWAVLPLLAALTMGQLMPSGADVVVRQDLATAGSTEGAQRLVRFVQVTDAHILDDDAPFPLRQEQLDARGAPFTSAQRPQEETTDEVLAAMVQAINTQHAQDPFDFVLFTGDSVDNALENEMMRFLDLVDGTTTTTGPLSGLACRPDGQSTDTLDAAHDVANACTSLPDGLPHPGLAHGLPWYQVLGNHDKLVQGNLAVLGPFEQQAAQRGRHFLLPGEAVAMQFTNHAPCPATGDAGHGFGLTGDRLCDGDASNDGYYAYSVGRVRFIVLDTVSPGSTEGIPLEQIAATGTTAAQAFGSHADGRVDDAQKAWLDADIAAHPDQLVVIASHHTLANLAPAQVTVRHCLFGVCVDSLENDAAAPAPATVLAQDLAARPHVVAWVGGHGHRDHIEPQGAPAGGFWSIQTAGLIDAPQESRIIEVWLTADGSKGFLRTEPLAAGQAAALALANGDPQRLLDASGGPGDRATLLWFNVPAGFVGPARLDSPTQTSGTTTPMAPSTDAPLAPSASSTGVPAAASQGPAPVDVGRKLPASGLLPLLVLFGMAALRRRG